MRSHCCHRAWVVAALAVGIAPRLLQAESAGGLRTAFGDVRLPSLAIGKTYSTWRLAAAPLVIENTSDDTIRVHVDVVIPARHELRPGARPVPDPAWVQFDDTDFVLAPHTTARTDVRLTLPYDPDLAGHTYQVDLWSGAVGSRVAVDDIGQRHPLLFTVEMDYRDDTEMDFACLDVASDSGAR